MFLYLHQKFPNNYIRMDTAVRIRITIDERAGQYHKLDIVIIITVYIVNPDNQYYCDTN